MTATTSRSHLVQQLRDVITAVSSEATWSPAAVAAQLRGIAANVEAASMQAPASAAKGACVEHLECAFAAPSAEEAADAWQRPRKAKQDYPCPFDFARYKQRFVALEVMYMGWAYGGFARQANSDNTIEAHLLAALRKVRLIPEEPDLLGALAYSRCGRTDKGVTALGQVIALKLRSNARADDPGDAPPPHQELDYALALNRALPPDIRALGWADVPEGFSARFNCAYREYKYFFLDHGSSGSGGGCAGGGRRLDLGAMRQAAAHLVGDHDFRNFCKADVEQVRNFRRVVMEVELEPLEAGAGAAALAAADGGGGGGAGEAGACAPVEAGPRVIVLRIRGTAFLYHQVRCIAAVLLMVGQGLELPSVVQRLLDVEATPAKPQYNLASEEPLLLHACAFEGLRFHRSAQLQANNAAAVRALVGRHLLGAALLGAVQARLKHDAQQEQCEEQQDSTMQQQQDGMLQQQQQQQQAPNRTKQPDEGRRAGVRMRSAADHIPLVKRATEPSMEERFRKAGIPLELLNQPGGGGGAAGAE